MASSKKSKSGSKLPVARFPRWILGTVASAANGSWKYDRVDVVLMRFCGLVLSFGVVDSFGLECVVVDFCWVRRVCFGAFVNMDKWSGVCDYPQLLDCVCRGAFGFCGYVCNAVERGV